MPKRMTRAQRNDDTRRRLLEAARKVFSKHGYYAATLDQVAEAAGFSKGAVYSQFDSKADLFLALYEARIEQRIAQLPAIRIGTGSTAAALESFSTQWFDSARADVDFQLLIMEFRLHVARNPQLRERYIEIYDRLRQAVAQAAAAALARNHLSAVMSPEDLTRLQMAIGPGLLLAQQLEPESFPEPLLALFNRALLQGVLSPSTAAKPKRKQPA